MKMDARLSKSELRTHFKLVRAQISDLRRKEASALALATIPSHLPPAGCIGSFSPIGTEIDLSPLNELLASENRLLLPKFDLSLIQISAILVPGLAFDSAHHRLGYGGGYYDILLSRLPKNIPTLGIGFKEQFSKIPLPNEPHDIRLGSILLF